jgi:hypothetical protein
MTVTPGTFGPTITGTAYQLLLEDALTGSTTLTVTSIEGITGLTFEAGLMTSGWMGPALPNPWNNGTFPDGIAFDSTVMIQVTADQLAGTQYYAVLVAKDEPPEITSLQIGAVFNPATYGFDPVAMVTNRGTPSANKDTVTAGSVVLTNSQAVAPMPILGTAGSGIAITFAKKTASESPADADFAETVAPDYASTFVHTPSYTFADGDVIWVKAVRGKYTNYYKVNVTVLDVNGPILTELLIQGDFDGGTYAYGYTATVSTGKPAATLEGITTPGSVTLDAAKVASNTDGLFLVGTDNDSTNSVYYTKTTGAAPSGDAEWVVETSMDFFGMTIYIPPAMAGFANGDALWARITDGTNTTYYKIVVTVE